MEERIKSLQEWCAENYLHYSQVSERIFNIGNKTFYLLLPINGKLVSKLCCFLIAEDEKEVVDATAFDHFLFQFGGRWYYCDKKVKVDDFNEEHYEANFIDLKYIGDATTNTLTPFVHLGVHSEYELLNGAHKADYWVKKAKFLKQTALGICDKDTLAGTLAFQLACEKEGIKSIIGMTATIQGEDQLTYEMAFFAKDYSGWQNLLQIARHINVENDGYITQAALQEHGAGVIAVFTKESLINYLSPKQGKALVNLFADNFADLYYAIDTVVYYNDSDDMAHLNALQNYLTHYWDVDAPLLKPLLLNDSYYLDREMHGLKEILNKVGKRATKYSEEQHYKTVDESFSLLDPLFANVTSVERDKLFYDMVNNTVELAAQCDFKINTGQHRLPRYKFIEHKSNEEHFWDLIEQGIEKKLAPYHDDLTPYFDRIKKEAKVIIGANFVDYFLILWDIVGWAKRSGILVGTGRGSIGGCLLAYLLDITDVDPVRYDLLFERFLNETRVSGERAKAADSMPDVDVDFASDRREEVKQYISERFGKLHTCSIGTFGRLKLKGAIKDFGRERGLNFEYLNKITKDIDDQQEYTFKDFVRYVQESENPNLYEFMQKNPDLVHLIKHTLGQAKTASIHASAVIIVPEEDADGRKMNIFNWLPVRKIDGRLVSEWEGKYTDRGGFLKEDILGLSQLDKFDYTLKLIKRNYGKKVVIDDRRIPIDDELVYKLFKRGHTEDVFQFTSSGLKSYSKEVKPEDIEDLTAMTSLYRPGPMDSNAHKDFAAIKHGKKEPEFDYGLQEVTEKTLGLLIYQEQIMKSVVVLGGFTLVESDMFRTAIKKFDKKTMDGFKEKFLAGAIARKCPPKDAPRIWDKLLAFSGYGFNRSHALAYSLISYFSQWFKVHYPLEFWTSSLHYAEDKQIPNRISEIRKLKQGIDLKPPSINYSGVSFECNVDTQTVYWSLSKIKGLGDAKVNAIIANREKGLFKSYDDFIARVPKKEVNKSTVTALILAGAFDEVEELDAPVQRYGLLQKHFARLKEPLPPEFTDEVVRKPYFWITKQKDLTGFGDISYVDMLPKKLQRSYKNAEQIAKAENYDEATVAGVVAFMRERKSRKGAFLTVELLCNNDRIYVVLWSDTYSQYRDFFASVGNKVIAITGKVKEDTYRGCNVLFSTDDTQVMEL